MMLQLKKWLFLTLLLMTAGSAVAQTSHPVHATVQVLPPYGLHLSDYYSGTRDRLVVTLLNRDQSQNELRVRLRVSVKNGGTFSLRSRDELHYPVLTLPYGIPFRLTSSDIAPYLSPDRVAMNGALQNGKLPVGMTEFSVEVLDYATGRALSQVGTGRVWLELKQPPILDVPSKDELIAEREPQFIRFRWMPRQQGVAATVYEFTLKELPGNGVAPQAAFAYGNPVYQTQTRFTTLNYTNLEPLLSPGKRYGWQVRAIAMDGADEVGVFENNGYSEVGWFNLGNTVQPPLGVTAEVAGYKKMTIRWQPLPEHTAFVVEYRPKSENDLYEWTSTQTTATELTAYQLTPGWAYEYRVGALSGDSLQPVFSPIGEITLPLEDEERAARCGQAPTIDLANQGPCEALSPGDVVIIGGDFPMTIVEASSQGNGWFSGKGWLTLPWVFDAKIAVKFNRLRINTDNRQIDGEVETEYDPDASQIADLNELDSGGQRTTEAARVEFGEPVALDFTVPPMPEMSWDPETGELTVMDEDGQPHIVEVPRNAEGAATFPMVVEDAAGKKYQVDLPEDDAPDSGSGGKIKPIVTPIVDVAGSFDDAPFDASAGVEVHFERGEGRFAFDDGAEKWYQGAQLLKKFYAPWADGYVAPWKLVPVGESDTVEARVASGSAADVKFVLKDGTGVPAAHKGDKWVLTLPSVNAGETYEVFAVVPSKKEPAKSVAVGKLRVVSYAKQTHRVTLVPVLEEIDSYAVGKITEQINAIYGALGVSVSFDVDNSLLNHHNIGDWDLDGDSALNISGSGFFSRETAEMKALRGLYQAAEKYTKEGYYLFVLSTAKADGEPDQHLAAQGDMPRGMQFGYIFRGGGRVEDQARTVAHELGHGIFALEHTFDVNFAGDKLKAQTTNLMDYADGTVLGAFQWNYIAHPAPLTFFDIDKDATDILQWDVAMYGGHLPQYQYSRPIEDDVLDKSNFVVLSLHDANDKTVGYICTWQPKSGGIHNSYILTSPNDLELFKKNIAILELVALLRAGGGQAEEYMLKALNQGMDGDIWRAAGTVMKETLSTPETYLAFASAAMAVIPAGVPRITSKQLPNKSIQISNGKNAATIPESIWSRIRATKFAQYADDLFDDVFNTQKAVIQQGRSTVANASTSVKGNFGEICSDVFLVRKRI